MSIPQGMQNLPGSIPGAPQTGKLPIDVPVLIQGEHKKASILPLLTAALFLVTSSSLYAFRYQLGGDLLWHVTGYILTPLLVSLALGWDSIWQRQGRKDPWFEPKPLYSKIIRLLVAFGFAVAVFHILEIGTICGQGFVQSGVFCGA